MYLLCSMKMILYMFEYVKCYYTGDLTVYESMCWCFFYMLVLCEFIGHGSDCIVSPSTKLEYIMWVRAHTHTTTICLHGC